MAVGTSDSRYRHHITDVNEEPIAGGVSGLVEVLSAEIDDTILRLIEKPSILLKPDPIVGDKFTRVASLVSSAYKRHGLILERTVLERLKQCPRLLVWSDKDFNVSEEAFGAANDTEVHQYKNRGQSLQVDAFVYDTEAKVLNAYEIKRASAYFDSGKRASIKDELKAVQVLLRSYGQFRGVPSVGRATLFSGMEKCLSSLHRVLAARRSIHISVGRFLMPSNR